MKSKTKKTFLYLTSIAQLAGLQNDISKFVEPVYCYSLTYWGILLRLPELHLSSIPPKKKKKTPENNNLTARGQPQNVTQRRVKIATRTNCAPNKTMNQDEEPPGFFSSLLPLTCFQWSQWYVGLLTFMYTMPFDLNVHLEANDTH